MRSAAKYEKVTKVILPLAYRSGAREAETSWATLLSVATREGVRMVR